jgi:putative transposase
LELVSISKERIMLLTERFISSLVGIQGQHPVSTDGWRYLVSTSLQVFEVASSYPFPYEKSIIIERTMQYMIKYRTECFDDYFPCRKKNCKLLHVWNWLNLFIGYHNKQLQIVK